MFTLLIIGLIIYAIIRSNRASNQRNNEALQEYIALIGDRGTVDIRELALKMKKRPGTVADELQKLIDQGYFGKNAYLDRARFTLYLSRTGVVETEFVEPEEEKKTVVREMPSAPKPEKRAGERSEKEPEARPERTRRQAHEGWQEDEYEAKLREIRQLNAQIDDPEVSRRIDEIGRLTASIFSVVRRSPERLEEVGKFMSYYLPTTLKLLESYAMLEKQSYQGENIKASRKKIEDILDTLIQAFRKQHDQLFREEALDVETDIQVLETMMAKDGLSTPKGLDIHEMLKQQAGGRK